MKAKPKRMTIEDLAKVVKTGFGKVITKDELREGLNRMATKDELDSLARMVKAGFDETTTKDDMVDLQQGLSKLEKMVDSGFNRLEGFIAGHERRLDKAEDNIRVIKTKIHIR